MLASWPQGSLLCIPEDNVVAWGATAASGPVGKEQRYARESSLPCLASNVHLSSKQTEGVPPLDKGKTRATGRRKANGALRSRLGTTERGHVHDDETAGLHLHDFRRLGGCRMPIRRRRRRRP